jgi:mRNA-degrading endonuclease YafQ of YafQ-DinJ toxin-antitoxin module
MIEIVLSTAFRKSFKRRIRGNKKLETRFRDRLSIFQTDPFDPRLRTHQLSDSYMDCGASVSISNCRVIFSFVEKERVLLVDIGTHEEVY